MQQFLQMLQLLVDMKRRSSMLSAVSSALQWMWGSSQGRVFSEIRAHQATIACVAMDVHDVVESKLAREPNNALFSSRCHHDHAHDVRRLDAPQDWRISSIADHSASTIIPSVRGPFCSARPPLVNYCHIVVTTYRPEVLLSAYCQRVHLLHSRMKPTAPRIPSWPQASHVPGLVLCGLLFPQATSARHTCCLHALSASMNIGPLGNDNSKASHPSYFCEKYTSKVDLKNRGILQFKRLFPT